jgi:hypothetical protein
MPHERRPENTGRDTERCPTRAPQRRWLRWGLVAPGLLAATLGQSCASTDEEQHGAADTPRVDDAHDVRDRPAPLFVAVGDICPIAGTEDDLRPQNAFDPVLLVKTKAAAECSGLGGEYLIGREIDSSRDYFVGGHGCSFLEPALRDQLEAEYWGLALVSQTAALFHTPEGWCITSLGGDEPVTSDSKVRAWALYESESAARAALAELSTAR